MSLGRTLLKMIDAKVAVAALKECDRLRDEEKFLRKMVRQVADSRIMEIERRLQAFAERDQARAERDEARDHLALEEADLDAIRAAVSALRDELRGNARDAGAVYNTETLSAYVASRLDAILAGNAPAHVAGESEHKPHCLLSKVNDGDWNQATAAAHGMPSCTCDKPDGDGTDLCGACFGEGCDVCSGKGLLPIGHPQSLPVVDATAKLLEQAAQEALDDAYPEDAPAVSRDLPEHVYRAVTQDAPAVVEAGPLTVITCEEGQRPVEHEIPVGAPCAECGGECIRPFSHAPPPTVSAAAVAALADALEAEANTCRGWGMGQYASQMKASRRIKALLTAPPPRTVDRPLPPYRGKVPQCHHDPDDACDAKPVPHKHRAYGCWPDCPACALGREPQATPTPGAKRLFPCSQCGGQHRDGQTCAIPACNVESDEGDVCALPEGHEATRKHTNGVREW